MNGPLAFIFIARILRLWKKLNDRNDTQGSKVYSTAKAPFNNYVDKMRGGRGSKMSVFVHAQGIKTVHAWGRSQKTAKFSPRSC